MAEARTKEPGQGNVIDPVQNLLNERQAMRDQAFKHADKMHELAYDIDRLDEPAFEKALHRLYEDNAKKHSAAKKYLDEYDAKVTTKAERNGDDATVTRWKELREREKALETAIDGGKEEVIDARKEALREHLEKEGLRVPAGRTAETNSVEKPLSEDQVVRLSTQAARTGPLAFAAITPEKADRNNFVEQDRGQKERDEVKEQEARERTPQQPSQKAQQDTERGGNEARDESAFNVAKAKNYIPPEIEQQYGRNGSRLVSKANRDKVEIIDRGNQMQTNRNFDERNVQNMVEIAKARGWSEMRVRGDEGFRREAWIEAQARGIEVKGYKPSERDFERADQRAKSLGQANSIEKNEEVERYRKTRDAEPAQRRQLAKEHPEIGKALALESAARSFAKQRLHPKNEEAFVDRTREMIERDLATGKSLPEVQRRQDRSRQQQSEQVAAAQRTPERESEQELTR